MKPNIPPTFFIGDALVSLMVDPTYIFRNALVGFHSSTQPTFLEMPWLGFILQPNLHFYNCNPTYIFISVLAHNFFGGLELILTNPTPYTLHPTPRPQQQVSLQI